MSGNSNLCKKTTTIIKPLLQKPRPWEIPNKKFIFELEVSIWDKRKIYSQESMVLVLKCYLITVTGKLKVLIDISYTFVSCFKFF